MKAAIFFLSNAIKFLLDLLSVVFLPGQKNASFCGGISQKLHKWCIRPDNRVSAVSGR